MTLPPLLVLLTCVVASVSYIGAVTQTALVTMVLPLVVAVGVVACSMRTRRFAAVVTVGLLAGAGGEAVNILSGNYQGSVARSAGVASLAAGLAVVASAGRRPALFLLPVAGIVAWALALGAGARVELVAVVTAAVALLTLAAVERDRRAFVTPPRLAGSVVLAFLLAAAAGVFAAQFQLRHDSRPAASPFRETLATTIEPPKIFSLTRHPPPSATKADPAQPAAAAPGGTHHPRLHQLLRELIWVLLGLITLMVLGSLMRLLWVSLAWRRLRRRLLRRSQPAEAGAWTWALATLDRLGSPTPVHISPDMASAGGFELSEAVRALAQTVVPAVFAPSPAVSTDDVWLQARTAVDDVWRSTGRLRRLRARWRTPRRPARAT